LANARFFDRAFTNSGAGIRTLAFVALITKKAGNRRIFAGVVYAKILGARISICAFLIFQATII
jgi:hypothetical protein